MWAILWSFSVVVSLLGMIGWGWFWVVTDMKLMIVVGDITWVISFWCGLYWRGVGGLNLTIIFGLIDEMAKGFQHDCILHSYAGISGSTLSKLILCIL